MRLAAFAHTGDHHPIAGAIFEAASATRQISCAHWRMDRSDQEK